MSHWEHRDEPRWKDFHFQQPYAKGLKRLKAEEKLRTIPVVIFSTSDNPNDVDFCYRNGASGFVLKVMDLPQQTNSLRAIIDYWFSAVLLPPGRRAG